MGVIPVDALLELAYMHYEEHHPARAVKLLEPLFADVVRHPRAGHEYALDLLCNCYDELGHHVKKASLLQRVVKTTQRSSLRSGALQRQAAIFMDNHDIPGAWNAFRQALRDDPKSLNIGILEVQLLISENRLNEAKQRAVFWKKKLHRAGIAPDEGPMTFLSAVAADPGAAMKNVGLGMSGGAGAGLDDWLQSVRNRPVPKYQASTEPPGMSASPKEAMIEGLKQMGIPQQELERNLSRLQGEIDFDVPEDTEAGSEEPQQEDPLATLFLIAPPAIRKLETKWHEAIPLSKPFSVHDTPFDAYDPWDAQEEERWVAFLNDHPEAFDSLDIIDDLATLLMLHEDSYTQWLDEGLLKPLLQRAANIMTEALKGVESPTIIWGFAENRPALRSLARLEFLASRQGNLDEAKMWANRLLNLNPDDNHGLRGMVINQLLRDGDDHGALKIAEKYPEDILPDILYGRVLALYRLNRPEEAKKALFAAMDSLPKVSRHLAVARVRKPRIDPMGSIHGGDDQAWLYREEMRDLWLAAPGAIDWLKTSAKLHPVNS